MSTTEVPQDGAGRSFVYFSADRISDAPVFATQAAFREAISRVLRLASGVISRYESHRNGR